MASRAGMLLNPRAYHKEQMKSAQNGLNPSSGADSGTATGPGNGKYHPLPFLVHFNHHKLVQQPSYHVSPIPNNKLRSSSPLYSFCNSSNLGVCFI
jgi:hypothetical protein